MEKSVDPVNRIDTPASATSRLPYLASGDGNTLLFSWVEDLDEENVVMKYARRSNGRWSEPANIATGSDWFVNWADFPSITVAGTQPVAVHWLHKIPGGTYSYEVRLSMADTATGRWKEALTPHSDATATEHGFVSMMPWSRTGVLAVWLDGRNTEGRTPEQYGDLSKAMTLRSAVIGTDGRVTEKNLIDGSVCDCCQTSLAQTGSGAVAAYRNRTSEEIRDIYVSRYLDGKWSDPRPVYRDDWNIGGCPVNGPKVVASGDSVLVAWFTGSDETNRVQAAFSFDGGATFNEPVRVDEGKPMGRVDAIFIGSGKAVVSWMEKSGDRALLKARSLDAGSNTPGRTTKITTMDPARRSGFPQMEYVGRHLIFAWTHLSDQARIRMAELPVEAFRN